MGIQNQKFLDYFRQHFKQNYKDLSKLSLAPTKLAGYKLANICKSHPFIFVLMYTNQVKLLFILYILNW